MGSFLHHTGSYSDTGFYYFTNISRSPNTTYHSFSGLSFYLLLRAVQLYRDIYGCWCFRLSQFPFGLSRVIVSFLLSAVIAYLVFHQILIPANLFYSLSIRLLVPMPLYTFWFIWRVPEITTSLWWRERSLNRRMRPAERWFLSKLHTNQNSVKTHGGIKSGEQIQARRWPFATSSIPFLASTINLIIVVNNSVKVSEVKMRKSLASCNFDLYSSGNTLKYSRYIRTAWKWDYTFHAT